MDDRYDVWLVSFDGGRGSAVQGLVRVFGVGADRAEQLLAALPHVVKHGVSRDEADRMKAALEGIGAHVEVHLARPRARAATAPVEAPPKPAAKDLSADAIAGAGLDVGQDHEPLSSLPAPPAAKTDVQVPRAPAVPRAIHESHLARLDVDSNPDSVAGAFAPSSDWRPPASGAGPDPVVVVAPRRPSTRPPAPLGAPPAPGAALRSPVASSKPAADLDSRQLGIGLGLFILGLALLGVGLLRRGSVLQGAAGYGGIVRDGFAFWAFTTGIGVLLDVIRRLRGGA
ncbi:MAG: ribosomal protein L7/L12 [Polyangiales bacterium]